MAADGIRAINLLTVVGARPQFVKAATLSRAIALHNATSGTRVVERILHTGQHYDANMSDVFFDELEIPRPFYHLDIGSGSHGAQTGRMLEKIEELVLQQRPDCLLVYGDTNSTLAAALVAAKLHVPLAHVEAGLRSYNRRMPEEVNRVLTDHVSKWLFCPTQSAVDNLRAEGITGGVELAGDVMYDGMLHYRKKASSTILATLGLKSHVYVLATVHRAENTDDPARLRAIAAVLANAAEAIGPVVLALHPRTRKMLADHGISLHASVRVIEPASYLEMIALMEGARAVMTDSGGVQKEAFFLEVPCLTLREETEWLETVESGANRLIGTDATAVAGALGELVSGRWRPDFSGRPYGSGHAADAIVASLVRGLHHQTPTTSGTPT